MKTVVLAEKPSVARELARVLGCGKQTKHYLEGRDYVVTWALGHLVELDDPAAYNPQWKNWELSYLPMLPQRMKHTVIRKTSPQFRAIKEQLLRRDVDKVIIATDAGREGELVARWILRLSGWKGVTQRLWISSQTDSAIRQGFKDLKPAADYDNLFRAAECRAEADWIIGLNVTRALVCKYDAKLSAGRVQTPTLAIIIQRENEIKNFIPEAFWTVQADFGDYSGTWQGSGGITRFKDQQKAQDLVDKTRGKSGRISAVEKKEKSEAPPLAYDLTELQRDANRILSFTAKKTLQVLQALYERHKLVTYPRTNSRHITRDMVPTLKERLLAMKKTPYSHVVKKLLSSPLSTGKRLVDDSKVTDHHAIIPTEQPAILERLSSEERALWNLIAERYLVVLSPPYRYESIILRTEVESEIFVTRGRRNIDLGWKAIGRGPAASSDLPPEGQEEETLQNLSAFIKGEQRQVKDVAAKQGFTKPPARYNEATLLSAMENPTKFIHDNTLKKSIQQGGLGTPATRADIIEKLFSNYYLERHGKEIIPTSKGSELIDLVPAPLKSPALTAQWELRLTQIAEGRENGRDFSLDIHENAKQLVTQIKNSSLKYQPKNLSGKTCPVCGSAMLAVRDKRGKNLLVCQARSCGYEEYEPKTANQYHRSSKKEQAMNRRMIQQYTDHSKETASFAELIKAAQDKKKRKDQGKKG